MISSIVHAQNYKGTIGKYAIHMNISTFGDNDLEVVYYYNFTLMNIKLEGNYKDSDFTFRKRNTTVDEKIECFTLEKIGNHFLGTWENDGKSLPVRLIQIEEDIEELKYSRFEFIRDSITVHGDKELVWFTEKYSGKYHFRLGNGFTAEQRNYFNPKLDSTHTYFAEIGLDCSWADLDVEIEFVSDSILSYKEISSIYCGGAHPSHGSSPYNLDLKNRKNLNEIFDLYPDLKYYQLLKIKYEEEFSPNVECDYFNGNAGQWNYISWIYTEKGIEISPSFPHAMTACIVGFLLTFEELENGID